jgi:hypothetical protein
MASLKAELILILLLGRRAGSVKHREHGHIIPVAITPR